MMVEEIGVGRQLMELGYDGCGLEEVFNLTWSKHAVLLVQV